MGSRLSLSGEDSKIRDIYERSILLPLIDQPDKVIENSKARRADQGRTYLPNESQSLFIFDGSIDLYRNDRIIHSFTVIRYSKKDFSTLNHSNCRVRFLRSQEEDNVHTDELLIYSHGISDVVCRFSSQTNGEDVILKSVLGDRVEIKPLTQYLTLATNTLVTKGASSTNPLRSADLVELLGCIPFFSNIPRNQLVELTEVSTIRVYPPKAVIFREDEGFSTQMFVTLVGVLEVSSSRVRGPIARLEPGSFFGEMALMVNIPRAATVTVVETCLLMSIEKKAFHTFIERLPAVKSSVRTLLKERLFIKAQMSGVLPYFKSIPPERVLQFSHQFTIKDQVRKGECLLDQCATPDDQSFGLVVYGVLEIISGETKQLGYHERSVFLTPGCYFGPFTFKRMNLHHGKVVARSTAVVLTCTFDHVKKLFHECPEAAAEAEIAWFGDNCNLATLLQHPVLSQQFQAFLEAEHSVENLIFYMDVHKFRAATRAERIPLAIDIHQKYIQPNAPLEVNLPATIRDDIDSIIQNLTGSDEIGSTCFDAASDEIMNLMTKDSFSRFKKLPSFQTIVEALDPHMKKSESKLLNACNTFQDSLQILKEDKVEHMANAQLEGILSRIRRARSRRDINNS